MLKLKRYLQQGNIFATFLDLKSESCGKDQVLSMVEFLTMVSFVSLYPNVQDEYWQHCLSGCR